MPAKHITLEQLKKQAIRVKIDMASKIAELAELFSAGLEETAEKQDKITGAKGQVAGFNESGELEAQSTEFLRGSQIYQGTAITGTNKTDVSFSGSGISSALVNDLYINTNTWDVYRCTVPGTPTAAKWVYAGNIKGANGPAGAAAGFGTPSASVDANVGTPSVTVTASGPDTAKVFNFAFKNLKGARGDTGSPGAAAGFGTPTASVDSNVGTPNVAITTSGSNTAKVFNFAFKNLKGATGATGKTAYQYAKEGGYTGTEAAFKALMGTGPWVPTAGGTMSGPLIIGGMKLTWNAISKCLDFEVV